MRLLLDEMWSPVIAQQMRRRGHDVAAVAERPDLQAQPDSVIFDIAQVESRTIVTENVIDFRLLAASELRRVGLHAGVIFTSNKRFPRHDSHTIGRIVKALDEVMTSGPDVTCAEHWL